MKMGRRREATGREAKGTGRARLAPLGSGAWLVTVLACALFAESAPQAGKESAAAAAPSASSLYERYQAVVERNIFSQSARSPRPVEPRPEGERTPPQPPPGAGYVLTGVVAGGQPALALVEESRSGKTQAYRVGAETPAGRVDAIQEDGVLLTQGESQRLIRVGYTLAGERSAKSDSVVTTLAFVPVAAPSGGGSGGGRTRGGGGPSASASGEGGEGTASASGGEGEQGSSAPPGGGSRGGGRRSGGGEATAGTQPASQNASSEAAGGQSREEIVRQLRERRNRETGGGGG